MARRWWWRANPAEADCPAFAGTGIRRHLPHRNAAHRMKQIKPPHRFIALITTVVVLCIVCNPELAGLAVLLDAYGIDVLMYLLSAQIAVLFADRILPRLHYLGRRWARPVPGLLLRMLLAVSGGYLRQLLWHGRAARATLLRPAFCRC